MVVKELNVFYGPEHGDEPVVISTLYEVDALIDKVRDEYRDKWAVQLEITLANDPVSAGLDVGVKGDVGVLFYSGEDFPDGCYSKGEDTGRTEELSYYYYRNNREYPPNAEIPLSLVKLAMRQFLEEGPKRPAGIEWQPYE